MLLIDDESLFHLVFEDACSLLDITLSLQTLNTTDECEVLFKKWQKDSSGKPECVFVDLNIILDILFFIQLIHSFGIFFIVALKNHTNLVN